MDTKQREFDLEFGIRIFHFSDNRFLIFLAASLIITFGMVLYLANIDYENLRSIVNSDIEERYITYLINSEIVPAAAVPEDDPFLDVAPDIFSLITESAANVIEAPLISPPIELNLDEIGVLTGPADAESEEKGIEDRFYRSSDKDVVRAVPGWVDDQMNVFEYSIARTAEISIKKPVYALEKKEEFGYRDQEEIMNVLYSKSAFIESCYQRQSRRTYIKEGFVKVEFHISPKGFVLPHTIKVIESTIMNRSLEQCIIKNIRRLREFEKLDSKYGIAKVTHKFVFR